MTNHLTSPVSEANEGRRGRPFSMRLTEEERAALNAKAAEARPHMPYEYGNGRQHGSVAHFLMWAAMQWAPPKPEADPEPAAAASTRSTRSAGSTRRRGSTGRRRPTKAKAKSKAKAKKGGRR